MLQFIEDVFLKNIISFRITSWFREKEWTIEIISVLKLKKGPINYIILARINNSLTILRKHQSVKRLLI